MTDPAARIAEIRGQTQRALSGETTGDPAFDGLAVVVSETGLPRRFIDDHIAGFQLDADEWRPRSESDLYRYCYHVAGVVGCMMAVVMGIDPNDDATLDRACDLGIAFQLANIARDIEEDDRSGRCYLPEEWLVEMDFPPGQHMKPAVPRAPLTVLARRMASEAVRYEDSARLGTTEAAVSRGLGGAGGGRHLRRHRAQRSRRRAITPGITGFRRHRPRRPRRSRVAAGKRRPRAGRYPSAPRDPGLWSRPTAVTVR